LNPLGPVPDPPKIDPPEPPPVVVPPAGTQVLHRSLAAPLLKMIKFNFKKFSTIKRPPVKKIYHRAKRKKVTRP
jgi:hypothetical protein